MTVWLSDIKMGYCTTGWWLTRKFCCLEVSGEGESCTEWRNWGGVEPFRYLFYIFFAVSTLSDPAYGLALTTSGPLLVLCCLFGPYIRAVRCGFRYLRDQVHLGRVHHQGIS